MPRQSLIVGTIKDLVGIKTKVSLGEETISVTYADLKKLPLKAAGLDIPLHPDLSAEALAPARNNWKLLGNGDTGPFKEFNSRNGGKASPVVFLYDLFYTKLFELDPALRPIFKTSMQSRGKMLVSMISHVLSALPPTPKLLESMTKLGSRHVGYGCQPEHFVTCGDALVMTLKDCSGDCWSDEVAHSWIQVYSFIVLMMIPALNDGLKKLRPPAKVAVADPSQVAAGTPLGQPISSPRPLMPQVLKGDVMPEDMMEETGTWRQHIPGEAC